MRNHRLYLETKTLPQRLQGAEQSSLLCINQSRIGGEHKLWVLKADPSRTGRRYFQHKLWALKADPRASASLQGDFAYPDPVEPQLEVALRPHWENIETTLRKHWEHIEKTLRPHWENIENTCKTLQTSCYNLQSANAKNWEEIPGEPLFIDQHWVSGLKALTSWIKT